MEIIDKELLDSVTEKARNNKRQRMNYNFHAGAEAPSQRLLNALEPGTVLPVHRHRNTDETYILLRGSIRVLFYKSNGELEYSCVLDASAGKYGVNIPAGCWHGLEVLAEGTVIFEVKDGPYLPLDEADILDAVSS